MQFHLTLNEKQECACCIYHLPEKLANLNWQLARGDWGLLFFKHLQFKLIFQKQTSVKLFRLNSERVFSRGTCRCHVGISLSVGSAGLCLEWWSVGGAVYVFHRFWAQVSSFSGLRLPKWFHGLLNGASGVSGKLLFCDGNLGGFLRISTP